MLTEEELASNGFPREDKSEGAPRGKAVLPIPDNKRIAIESCKGKQCTVIKG